MAGLTKMIIITSDEDIIRQFSLNSDSKKTHIIDLDNHKQTTSIPTDNNNIINLDFLTHLSAANSNNDQVYKRALESSDHNQSKPVKVPKKSREIICSICGDYAIGYNFDVLSCASCKAFFRRNANQNMEKIRCLTGKNQCSVAHEVPRKCTKCRLKRCFEMGMRKDFMKSKEERERKKQSLEENRTITLQHLSTSESTTPLSVVYPLSDEEVISTEFNEIDQLLLDMDKDVGDIVLQENSSSNEIEDISPEALLIEDFIVIERIQSAFLSIFRDNPTSCPCTNVSDRASAIISWSEVASQLAQRFIKFFRMIDEFEGLHADDRFILIKYNLLPLFTIHKCFCYNRATNGFTCGRGEVAINHHQFYVSCLGAQRVRESFITMVISLVEITEQDPVFLSFLLIILLFSQGLSMCEDEPLLQDPLAVARAQSYYAGILWSYLVNKSGEIQACKQFTRLLNEIFRIQFKMSRFREFIRREFTTPDTLDKIAPLMQTVLHIA